MALVLVSVTAPVDSPRQYLATSPEKSFAPQAARIDVPLGFEPNRDEPGSEVKFFSRGQGYDIALTKDGCILSFRDKSKTRSNQMGIKLLGARPASSLKGVEELEWRSNHLIGDDPAGWRTGIANYAKVKYSNVYSGIDLLFYGRGRDLEYDFIVAPGADPRAIRIAFEGAERVGADESGDLILEVGEIRVRQHRPVTYQEAEGIRLPVASRYVVDGSGEVSFEVGGYDASRPLIIDPVLSYSSYLGGSGADEAWAVAVDSTGAAYVVGHTTSTDFPLANPSQPAINAPAPSGDVFIARLNSEGTGLIYSTYLGGSQSDYGLAVAVDSTGNAYVTGYTNSADFPTTAGALQTSSAGGDEAFITKLSPSGGLVYSAYLGGSNNERSNSVALDGGGNAYLAGRTTSDDFPATPGAAQSRLRGVEDAFVAKVNGNGSALVYATYLGGTSNTDEAFAVAVDASGNAYVTGGTVSADFPTTAGAFQRTYGGGLAFLGDAFVTKLNQSGTAFLYSTYLGGSAGEQGNGIAIGGQGGAYVTGATQSTNFPTARALQNTKAGDCQDNFSNCLDLFVARLNDSGTGLIFSTYLGGGSRSQSPFGSGESARAIAVDQAGNIYIAGTTGSADFPTTRAIQPSKAGNGDAFITKMSAEGSNLIYSTYLGGVGDESASSIAVDAAGNLYIAGIATSTGFPTTANTFQSTFAGSYERSADARDGFVAKITGDLPSITGASVSGKQLLVTGKDFAPGAEVLLDGKKQKKTLNDPSSPATLLVAKKSGKKIARGQTVIIQVRNPGGATSAPFSFTR